jgi:nucleotide-binding universal stress UspA family protein
VPRHAIAVATDFSEQAERARQVAVALARKLGASIVLIHTIEPYPADAPLTEEARRQLKLMADAVRAAGVEADVELIHGYAEDAVAQAANRVGVQLLVMGTHGRRAPLRWVLGSVAERTLQSSDVPVLVVGQDGGAFAAWADGTRPLRLAIALESVAPAESILDMARLFHRAGGCQLDFIHVMPRTLGASRLPALLERVFHDRLAEFGATPRLVAAEDSLASAIANSVADHACDLVIVGIHARSGFDFPRTAELARALLHHRVSALLGVPLPAAITSRETPTFDSILAPTDLSELGNHAIAHAYALSRGGSITLLHVHVAPDGLPLDERMRSDLELRLLALVPSDSAARGISTEVVIVEGEKAAPAIVDAAIRLGCQIICMGSHGRSAVGRIVLGSVAEEVLHRFPRAVLIVR